MIPHSSRQKHIAIISDNPIVFDAIRDNTEYPIIFFDADYKKSIDSASRIDLLIIDKNIESDEIPLYRINTLINLTDNAVSRNEINLSKPFKLNDLLDIISRNMQDEYLFCCINTLWIYHQRAAKLRSKSREILLTDKENALFMEILTSKNFSASKKTLKSRVWNYHQDSESTTVETHLYKLKHKLPEGFLDVRATQCHLHIASLV